MSNEDSSGWSTTTHRRRKQPRKETGDQTKKKSRKLRIKDEQAITSRNKDMEIEDLRARYWSYLFENFHRAVDEIYYVCEVDESKLQCQEMIMLLEVCRNDFEALIKRFKMQREYEKSSEGRSLAWEVRKSPSKHHGTFESYLAKQRRSLEKDVEKPAYKTGHAHLDTPPKLSPTPKPVSRSYSWADRVRGVPQSRTESTEHRNGNRIQPIEHRNESNGIRTESTERRNESNGNGNGIQPTEYRNESHSDNKTDNPTVCRSHSDSAIIVMSRGNKTETHRNEPLDDDESIIAAKLTSTIPSQVTNQNQADVHNENTVSTDKKLESPVPKEDDEHINTTPSDTNRQNDSSDSESLTTPSKESWKDFTSRYSAERSDIHWADSCDSPPLSFPDQEGLENRDSRSPGRAIQLHQKLSSPLRKKSTEQSIKMLEERQVKAEMFREKRKEEMMQKSKHLTEKIKEVQLSRNSMTMQKKEAMEEKLERAEKLRVSHLQEIVRRAQEEDIKVNEIAFINTLGAQNKKMEVLERHQGVEARLQDKLEERQKRIEENLAKEEAALERRKAIEAERKAKLLELNQKRKEQDAKFELMKQEKERAREEAAKERERKLEARQAALQLSTEELEKKIQLKHDSSSKRYDQHLVYRKERAQMGSTSRHSSTDYAPCVEAYQKKKWCNVCKVKIISEVYLLSHLKGKRHRDCLIANDITEEQTDVIVLAPDSVQKQTISKEVEERLKAGKKRAKRLRQKMTGRVTKIDEMTSDFGTAATQSKSYQRLSKLIKNVNRFLDSAESIHASQVTSIEKTLTELSRILKKNRADQSSFCHLGGLTSLSRLILLHSDIPCGVSRPLTSTATSIVHRSLSSILHVLEPACTNSLSNAQFMIMSNKFTPIVDLTHKYFTAFVSCPTLKTTGSTNDPSPLQNDSNATTLIETCGCLFNVLAVIMSSLVTEGETLSDMEQTVIRDCLSYVVSIGLMDQLAEYFRSVTGPLEDVGTAHLIISGVNMLLAFTAVLHIDVKDVFNPNPPDPTLIITVLGQTDLAGILSLLYALLLHDGPPRHSYVPPVLPPYVLSITAAGIRTINNCSIVGLKAVQNCVGAEGLSLEFRHVIGYLLWYCTHHQHTALLHELILSVGYFCVLNIENQMFLLAGRSPTLLQLLCGLPFEYFSDPNMENILFPTLISSCYRVPDSKDILKLEINCKLLCTYLKVKIEERAKNSIASGKRDFMSLQYRFPELHWKSALEFFAET